MKKILLATLLVLTSSFAQAGNFLGHLNNSDYLGYFSISIGGLTDNAKVRSYGEEPSYKDIAFYKTGYVLGLKKYIATDLGDPNNAFVINPYLTFGKKSLTLKGNFKRLAGGCTLKDKRTGRAIPYYTPHRNPYSHRPSYPSYYYCDPNVDNVDTRVIYDDSFIGTGLEVGVINDFLDFATSYLGVGLAHDFDKHSPLAIGAKVALGLVIWNSSLALSFGWRYYPQSGWRGISHSSSDFIDDLPYKIVGLKSFSAFSFSAQLDF